MKTPSRLDRWVQASCLAIPIALVACGGTSSMLSGTAAPGASVVGRPVSVKCAGRPVLTTTTTSAGA